MSNVKNEILEAGMVTSQIQNKYFDRVGFKAIRDYLESIGMDRHTAIELQSTEICIMTPFGIMMQIRPTDNNQLGMWGGVLNSGEAPEDGAVRELKEETGIEIDKSQLEFVEVDDHTHEYANGDKVFFHCFRYVLRLDHVPQITTDEESVGAYMVVHTILGHQQEFIKRMLGEKK